MKVITLLNEKGGVGKTTLATTIAAGLSRQGLRVVLVDCDPQGHATIGMGLPKLPKLYDLVIRGADWKDTLASISGWDRLFIVPGNVETRSIPLNLTDTFYFDTRLRELEGMIDVIVIDTPPTPSLFHGSIFLATDQVILPTALEFYSIDGLRESLAHVGEFNKRRGQAGQKPIEIMGIVPNRAELSTMEHDVNYRDLKALYPGYVWDVIAKRVIWQEAATAGRPVFDYAPSSAAAADANRLIDRVLEGVA